MHWRNTSHAANAVSWLLGSALLTGAACGGTAFSDDGGTSGRNARAGATAGGHAATGSTSAGQGADSLGGSAAGAASSGPAESGAPASSEAGAAGSGGAGDTFECSDLNGSTFAEHCYADVTVESVTQIDAVAACTTLASKTGRNAQLLVLDSAAEQSFIIANFLSELTDAWLALTCSSIQHSDLSECYCLDCADGQLLQKRAVWGWLDGSTSTFGWTGSNPDGGGRCSALAFNPTIAKWGWVDRSCLSTSHQLTGLTPHSYRVICELW